MCTRGRTVWGASLAVARKEKLRQRLLKVEGIQFHFRIMQKFLSPFNRLRKQTHTSKFQKIQQRAGTLTPALLGLYQRTDGPDTSWEAPGGIAIIHQPPLPAVPPGLPPSAACWSCDFSLPPRPVQTGTSAPASQCLHPPNTQHCWQLEPCRHLCLHTGSSCLK